MTRASSLWCPGCGASFRKMRRAFKDTARTGRPAAVSIPAFGRRPDSKRDLCAALLHLLTAGAHVGKDSLDAELIDRLDPPRRYTQPHPAAFARNPETMPL